MLDQLLWPLGQWSDAHLTWLASFGQARHQISIWIAFRCYTDLAVHYYCAQCLMEETNVRTLWSDEIKLIYSSKAQYILFAEHLSHATVLRKYTMDDLTADMFVVKFVALACMSNGFPMLFSHTALSQREIVWMMSTRWYSDLYLAITLWAFPLLTLCTLIN